MQTEEYARLFEHEDRYWWFVGRRRLALSLLRTALDSSTDSTPVLLDLGCGTGAALHDMGRIGRAIGLDVSELALSFSRSRGLASLVLGNGERIPFRSSVFDGVIALDIFEHIRDDTSAFAEAFRSIKPGGVLVLSVPAFLWLWGPHDVALMHQRRYTLRQVRLALERAGFQVERISYSVFLLFPAVMVVRLMNRLHPGPAKVSLPHVPGWLNRLLTVVQQAEVRWIAHSRLPWGSSVVAVARKPQNPRV